MLTSSTVRTRSGRSAAATIEEPDAKKARLAGAVKPPKCYSVAVRECMKGPRKAVPTTARGALQLMEDACAQHALVGMKYTDEQVVAPAVVQCARALGDTSFGKLLLEAVEEQEFIYKEAYNGLVRDKKVEEINGLVTLLKQGFGFSVKYLEDTLLEPFEDAMEEEAKKAAGVFRARVHTQLFGVDNDEQEEQGQEQVSSSDDENSE